MNRRQVLTGVFVAYNFVLIFILAAEIFGTYHADIGISTRHQNILVMFLCIIGLLINIFSAIFYRKKTLMVFACVVNAIYTVIAMYYLWFVFMGRDYGRDIAGDGLMSLLFISVPLFYFTLLRAIKNNKYRYAVLAPAGVILAISLIDLYIMIKYGNIELLFFWPIFLIFIGPIAISGAIFVWVITASKKNKNFL